MPTKQEALKRITKQIADFKAEVELYGKLGWTDIHKHAEQLFCAPLALVLGDDVIVLEHERKDYPAIDLYCKKSKIGIQVTSTNTREKIQHTLDETRKHLNGRVVQRVIVLIIGNKRNFRDKFNPPDWLPFSKDRDIWDMQDLLMQIDRTCNAEQIYNLSADLDYQNKDRATMMVEDIKTCILQMGESFEYLASQLQPGILHNSLPYTPTPFLHNKLLAQLKEQTKQTSPVFLIGPPGAGKKTLATQMGHEYRDGNVHYVAFHGSFKDTISQELSRGILSSYDLNRLTPEELCNQTLQRLQEKDLLIIHDALLREDFESCDTYFIELCKLPIKLIITTAYDVSGIFPNTLRMTPPEQTDKVLQLMPKRLRRDNSARDLITEAENYPGMVRILADFLRDEGHDIQPARMFNILRSGALADEMPTLYQQFQDIAPVTGLKKREQAILRFLVFVREEMTESLFRSGLNDDGQMALDYLCRTGWVSIDAQKRLRFSSPIIRLVSRTELPFSYENCSDFLINLAIYAEFCCCCHDDCEQITKCIDRAKGQITGPVPLELYEIAEKIARLSGRNNNNAEDILSRLSGQQNLWSYQDWFYMALKHFIKDSVQPDDIKEARKCMESAINTATMGLSRKGLPPAPDNDLALLYHNYAVLCEKDKALDEAEKYYLQAYQQMSYASRKAETCISLSQLYTDRQHPGDDEKAFQFAQEAVNISGSNLTVRRKAYLLCANLHLSRQEFSLAHDNAVESLRIARTQLSPDNEILQQTYRRAAKTSLALAINRANAATAADSHPDTVESCFEQARYYVEEALDYAVAANDTDGKQDAYIAMMYTYQQAIRGKYRHQALVQAEAYIQEAVTAFHNIPMTDQDKLIPMVINLAKLYQAIALDLSAQKGMEEQLQTWFRIWEFCAGFECLRDHAQKTVYPQIISSAEQYGRKLRSDLRSSLPTLPRFYKQMIDFFSEIGDNNQKNVYLRDLKELDDLMSAVY